MRIRSIGVVGAGTMGGGIAALAASVGIPVVLLDVAGNRDRNEPAKRGLDRALKSRPPSFLDARSARLITLGNIEDDLPLLAGCDWIIEAVVEQPGPKRALYAQLEPLLGADTIISSNTSGIPMQVLTEGRSPAFRKRFFGTHFFNPPRYLHLLEIIPGPETDPVIIETVEQFADVVLGKGTVRAKDVPGFIGNRLGVYGMLQAIRLMEQTGLSIDEVDALTGPLIGRPRSATFRTADLTGLDILLHVADGLSEATGEDYGLPDWVRALVADGRLGEKSGAGFYKRVGRDILTLNPTTMDYEPRAAVESPELGALARRPLAERLRGALDLPGAHGEFLRSLFFTTSHQTLTLTPQIAWDVPSVDHALEWGFAWEMGPFRQMDAVGLDVVRDGLRSAGLDEPTLLRTAGERFYDDADGLPSARALDGTLQPLRDRPGVVSLPTRKSEGRTLIAGDDASVIDLGDGVAMLELHSRLNTLGERTFSILRQALELVDQQGYVGLVIGSDDARAFSAGANLNQIASLAREGDWAAAERDVDTFQQATMSLRRAPFPVVAAAFGLALGGGAEVAMHSDHVQAAAELNIGLVEVGVGLIPAGGGTKELLVRFTQELEPYIEADPFEAVRRAFMPIALAQTSQSAHEARAIGFLRPHDRITMNRDRLIGDAKAAVLALAPGYVAPVDRRIRALGQEALGNLRMALWTFREAGQASDHDVIIGEKLAWVLAAGDGPPREVSEQDLLDFEREAFLSLLGTQKTQQRIDHMLQTGKPLRN
ncbi:MAG: 3-hydroxyacyl-CoA dehydrogenase/enoyl-CoA hydratase family protein [Thermomicrobiales bacterium]|nr:3-hydroxyacyl-CoA dehydrogenase/enoyl-CoA hydratase family protein [Thermomicrobiales bacterium]